MSELIERIRAKALREGTLRNRDAPLRVWGGAWTVHPTAKVGHKSFPNDPSRADEVIAYGTRPTVDLEDEVVTPNGLDLDSYFAKNRNLFVDHSYDILSAVARARNVRKDAGGVLVHGQFIDTPDNPYVKACIALAKMGTLGMSIGMEALDFGAPTKEESAMYPAAKSIIRRARVIEISYTALPMNADCRQVTGGEAEDKARKAFADANIPPVVAERFGIKRRVIVCVG